MINDQIDDKILQSPLFDKIHDYFLSASGTKKTAYVIAPYIKSDILEKLLENVDTPTIVITSWRPDDIIRGSSDVDAYKICQKIGAKLYIHNNIHLKIYSIDLDNAILSTANISKRGLGIETNNPNIECATMINNLSNNDRMHLAYIQNDATLVDDDMYSWIKIWLSKQKMIPEIVDVNDIFDMMNNKNSFLISALPMSRSVDEFMKCYHDIENGNIIEDVEVRNCAFHDIANYSIPKKLSEDDLRVYLKNSFFNHSFIMKIDDFIKDGEYFGTIKSWIHDNCTDVPIPSKRELTSNVQVLLDWFVNLGDGMYVVDVPGRHSQRIYKIKK